jgi:hypothetical protein
LFLIIGEHVRGIVVIELLTDARLEDVAVLVHRVVSIGGARKGDVIRTHLATLICGFTCSAARAHLLAVAFRFVTAALFTAARREIFLAGWID